MVKVLLDLDTGIDDAMALAYALGNKEVDLIGVTGTFGNVYTEDGVQNVLNILNMCHRNDVPVYAGETHSITSDHFDRLEVSARIHGENGVGQVHIEPSPRQKEAMSGVDFLIASVKQYKQELVIVTTGPPVLRIGIILAIAALFAILLFTDSKWSVFASVAFLGIAYNGLILTTINGLGVIQSPDEAPGALPGINGAGFGIGASLGIGLVAPFVAQGTLGGYTAAMWVSITITILALVASLFIAPKKQAA